MEFKATQIREKASLLKWIMNWAENSRISDNEARQISVQIAHRAALRVLPLAWNADPRYPGQIDDGSILFSARCLAISSGVSASSPNDIDDFASFAASAYFDATTNPRMRSSIVSVVDAAAARTPRDAAVRSAAAVGNAASEYNAATTERAFNPNFWLKVSEDIRVIEAGNGLIGVPLWTDPVPNFTREFEAQLHGSFLRNEKAWEFWSRFYEKSEQGETFQWELLLKISEISNIDWKMGPERIAELIAQIEKSFQIDQIISDNPLGQRIVRSKKTGTLKSEPIEERDLSLIVKDIQRSLREFNCNCKKERRNIGLALVDAFAPHIDELRKRVSKNKENPRELLRSIEDAYRAFYLVAKTEVASEHVQVDRLLNGLQDRAADVGVSSPEVMDEIKRRRAVKVQLMTAQQITLAVRISAGMAADSRGLLQAAISRALLVVASEEATDDEKAAAWTFLLGAIPRGAKLKHEAGEVGTDASKDSSAFETVVGYADKLNKLDKGVDALQEAAAEGGPWVTEAFTQISSGNFWGILS
ncbi:hypothetical protein [Planktotalea arctica]